MSTPAYDNLGAVKKRVTSQQVAKLAGVSRTTVSFVLNGVEAANISQLTKDKVLRAADELGYVPNAAAKMLVSGETRTIGLVVSHAEHFAVDAFIPQLLHSLSHHSHNHGYRVLLETVQDVSQPDAYLRLVQGQHIDGLVVVNTRSDDSQLPELVRRRFPVVVLGFPDWFTEKLETHVVGTDGVGSAQVATEHLIALGHTQIAHITFSPEQYYATQDRHLGYRQALEQHGLVYNQKLVAYGDYSAASGYLAMQQILARQRPTALFAGNDTIALGAISAIWQAGLRIPHDIAVVGYDDIPTSPYMQPPLTTVRVPASEHGRLAILMLSRLMRGETVSKQREICETPLIVRQSCGAQP
jgi:DNA-binding LacI/PurR family transcriptional regulator